MYHLHAHSAPSYTDPICITDAADNITIIVYLQWCSAKRASFPTTRRFAWNANACRVVVYDQLKSIEAAAAQYSDILVGRSTTPDDQGWSRLSREYEALQQQQQMQRHQQEGRLNKLIQDLLASMAPSQVRGVAGRARCISTLLLGCDKLYFALRHLQRRVLNCIYCFGRI
jgi:hypothetical protein